MLKRQTILTEAEIREHVLPLTDGLAEVHAAGLLHRDIKPGNIMVRANGIPVLIDFGSARQAVNAKSRKLTAVGTDGYAPREQYYESKDEHEATDIYALGAVLYRCVTGNVPDSALERYEQDKLVPVAEASTDGAYSEGLLAAIDAALAIREFERPLRNRRIPQRAICSRYPASMAGYSGRVDTNSAWAAHLETMTKPLSGTPAPPSRETKNAQRYLAYAGSFPTRLPTLLSRETRTLNTAWAAAIKTVVTRGKTTPKRLSGTPGPPGWGMSMPK